MFGRGPLFFVAVAGALFIPYWLSEHNAPGTSSGWWGTLEGDPLGTPWQPGTGRFPIPSSSPMAGSPIPYRPIANGNGMPNSLGSPISTWPPNGMTGGVPGSGMPPGPATAGPRVQSLEELFRFDATSAWIMNRWARVSTGLIDQDLEGLRVTLVSGTGNYDLAGSLTYYFDRQYQVQRISFKGLTPDPSRLVEFMMRTYGLRPDPLLGAGLFLTPEGSAWLHGMRIHHAPVVRANLPQQRYSVLLELNRPGTGRTLSPVFTTVLENDRRARRWQPPAAEQPAAPPAEIAPTSPDAPAP